MNPATNGSPGRSRQRHGPISTMLGLFPNVWFGVVLASVLFVYCSIGSAVPAIRQLPALEMTEFEWFHWWPFNVLVALMCITMTVVTIRRIPFRLVNLGVWTIHSGIIMLTLGSYYYFTTKVEGDTPVYRRHVKIDLPGMEQPARLVALPGNSTDVVVGPDRWRFAIQDTNNSWPILSGDDKGKTAHSVNVAVTPPFGEPFVRQLLAGFEQYTEDVLPGKGRAIKAIGRKLVDEKLSLTLAYEPQPYFHVMDTWALFVRKVGDREWQQRPIEGLPRYHDRIPSRELVFTENYAPISTSALDVPIPPTSEVDAMGQITPHIVGYLRYAHMERRWREGGDRLNPVLKMSVLSGDNRAQHHELAALDREHSTIEGGLVQFVWLDDAAAVATLPTDSRPVLRISVPAANVQKELVISPDMPTGRDAPFTEIEQTEFAWRLIALQDNLVLPGRNTPVSIALVEIRTPEGSFRRWVANPPEFTRDMHGEGADPHATDAREPDARLHMTYQPQSSPLIFAGYPGGVHLVFNGPDGRVFSEPVTVGSPRAVIPGLSLRVDGVWERAVPEVKPLVVPPNRRDRDARETFSMIRLEWNNGTGVDSRWIQFNQYALPSRDYAYAGRFAFSPERIRLPDGTMVEVLFSRQRRELPAPIALDSFELDTHIGGYTGMVSTIRNYVSKLRFQVDGQWSAAQPIAVNAPTEHGGYWYFQSMWDKPGSGNPAGGMNYTGLGVGNRNGVYIQLAGCCLSVAGMIFAFYVKPVIKRRRAERARARIGGTESLEASRVPRGTSVEVPV